MSLQSVRGTHDLLPPESLKHRWIISQALQQAQCYGFEEIATPILEFSEVFGRTLGESSDIVNKEMYTFVDKGGESLTLRPEGTAGVARAFISEGLSQHLPLKFIYQGPMFRHERPQKGRLRQFHQIGVEYLGVETHHADLECLALGWQMLNRLQLQGELRLEINSIGDKESRLSYTEALKEFLTARAARLSEDSQRRLKTNPLRILDSKDPNDQTLLKDAPRMGRFLNEVSRNFYSSLKKGLESLGIPYRENELLVRGLDYYSHSVFEIKARGLGSQDTVLAGGRYDGLISQMGGPATPGVGWACGIERLSLLSTYVPKTTRPLALIPMGDEAEALAFKWAYELRNQSCGIEIILGGNLGKRMKKANKVSASAAVIVGSEEIAKSVVVWKDLDSGQQDEISTADFLKQAALKSKLNF